METISITLPTELAVEVHQAVASGEYTTSSELVSEALSEWNKRRGAEQPGTDRLRAVWQEALDDERAGLAPEPVFSRLRKIFRLEF